MPVVWAALETMRMSEACAAMRRHGDLNDLYCQLKPWLHPAAMPMSVVLLPLGSVLMSQACVVTRGHVDAPGLDSHLRHCAELVLYLTRNLTWTSGRHPSAQWC